MGNDASTVFHLGLGALAGIIIGHSWFGQYRAYAASGINCDKPVPWNPTARKEYNALPPALKPAYIKKRQAIFQKLCKESARAIHHDELFGGKPLDNKGGIVTSHYPVYNTTDVDIHTAYTQAYAGNDQPEESENDMRSHRWTKRYGCRKIPWGADNKWVNVCTGVGSGEGVHVAPALDPTYGDFENELGKTQDQASEYAYAYPVKKCKVVHDSYGHPITFCDTCGKLRLPNGRIMNTCILDRPGRLNYSPNRSGSQVDPLLPPRFSDPNGDPMYPHRGKDKNGKPFVEPGYGSLEYPQYEGENELYEAPDTTSTPRERGEVASTFARMSVA